MPSQKATRRELEVESKHAKETSALQARILAMEYAVQKLSDTAKAHMKEYSLCVQETKDSKSFYYWIGQRDEAIYFCNAFADLLGESK